MRESVNALHLHWNACAPLTEGSFIFLKQTNSVHMPHTLLREVHTRVHNKWPSGHSFNLTATTDLRKIAYFSRFGLAVLCSLPFVEHCPFLWGNTVCVRLPGRILHHVRDVVQCISTHTFGRALGSSVAFGTAVVADHKFWRPALSLQSLTVHQFILLGHREIRMSGIINSVLTSYLHVIAYACI